MDRFLGGMDRLLAASFRGAIIILMAMITVVVFLQVASRYLFDFPLEWSEEVSRFGFVWLVFAGAGLLVRTGDHLKVSTFVDPLPGKAKRVIAVAVEVAILICAVFFFAGGWRLARNEWRQLSPAIEAPMGIVYLVIPVSAAFMVLWSVVRLARAVAAVGETRLP